MQVTHGEMQHLVVEAGVAPDKVFMIPIGIDLEHFPLAAERGETQFVIGSFVKDGVGMEDGLEPKVLKGPDVLVAVIERVRESLPDCRCC